MEFSLSGKLTKTLISGHVLGFFPLVLLRRTLLNFFPDISNTSFICQALSSKCQSGACVEV